MTKAKLQAPVGAGLIVLASVFYASYGIWTKYIGNFISGYPATMVRSAVVLTILLPIATKMGGLSKLDLKKNGLLLLCLIASSAVIWGPLTYAILNAGVGITIAVSYAGIIIGMFFFGWMFFGEKLTKAKILSSLIGLAGLALIFVPGNAKFGLLALGAAVGSGIASGFNMTVSKKLSYSATQSTIMLWATGLIANTAMMVIVGEQFPPLVWDMAWLYLLIFGLASVVASWSFVAGLKRIDAGAAGILGLLEIVFGIIFGVVIFSEQPGFWAYTGSAMIMLAAALPYVRNFDIKRGRLK